MYVCTLILYDIKVACGTGRECLDDNFLAQHVSSPTRKDSILDLIISDEPDMISNLLDLGPLATSE